MLRKYTRVVAVSDEVKQRLLKAGVRAGNIRMVRNGIDLLHSTGRFSHGEGRAADAHRWLAWLADWRGRRESIYFCEAAAEVLVEIPETRFKVVGEGPDREKLERMIDRLNIHESVTLLGRREDMASVVRIDGRDGVVVAPGGAAYGDVWRAWRAGWRWWRLRWARCRRW